MIILKQQNNYVYKQETTGAIMTGSITKPSGEPAQPFDKKEFTKTLQTITDNKFVRINSQGKIVKASLPELIREQLKGMFGKRNSTHNRLIELKVIEILEKGYGSLNINEEDIALINKAAKKLGLIKSSNKSTLRHEQLNNIITKITKAITNLNQTSISENQNQDSQNFQKLHENVLNRRPWKKHTHKTKNHSETPTTKSIERPPGQTTELDNKEPTLKKIGDTKKDDAEKKGAQKSDNSSTSQETNSAHTQEVPKQPNTLPSEKKTSKKGDEELEQDEQGLGHDQTKPTDQDEQLTTSQTPSIVEKPELQKIPTPPLTSPHTQLDTIKSTDTISNITIKKSASYSASEIENKPSSTNILIHKNITDKTQQPKATKKTLESTASKVGKFVRTLLSATGLLVASYYAFKHLSSSTFPSPTQQSLTYSNISGAGQPSPFDSNFSAYSPLTFSATLFNPQTPNSWLKANPQPQIGNETVLLQGQDPDLTNTFPWSFQPINPEVNEEDITEINTSPTVSENTDAVVENPTLEDGDLSRWQFDSGASPLRRSINANLSQKNESILEKHEDPEQPSEEIKVLEESKTSTDETIKEKTSETFNYSTHLKAIGLTALAVAIYKTVNFCYEWFLKPPTTNSPPSTDNDVASRELSERQIRQLNNLGIKQLKEISPGQGSSTVGKVKKSTSGEIEPIKEQKSLSPLVIAIETTINILENLDLNSLFSLQLNQEGIINLERHIFLKEVGNSIDSSTFNPEENLSAFFDQLIKLKPLSKENISAVLNLKKIIDSMEMKSISNKILSEIQKFEENSKIEKNWIQYLDFHEKMPKTNLTDVLSSLKENDFIITPYTSTNHPLCLQNDESKKLYEYVVLVRKGDDTVGRIIPTIIWIQDEKIYTKTEQAIQLTAGFHGQQNVYHTIHVPKIIESTTLLNQIGNIYDYKKTSQTTTSLKSVPSQDEGTKKQPVNLVESSSKELQPFSQLTDDDQSTKETTFNWEPVPVKPDHQFNTKSEFEHFLTSLKETSQEDSKKIRLEKTISTDSLEHKKENEEIPPDLYFALILEAMNKALQNSTQKEIPLFTLQKRSLIVETTFNNLPQSDRLASLEKSILQHLTDYKEYVFIRDHAALDLLVNKLRNLGSKEDILTQISSFKLVEIKPDAPLTLSTIRNHQKFRTKVDINKEDSKLVGKDYIIMEVESSLPGKFAFKIISKSNLYGNYLIFKIEENDDQKYSISSLRRPTLTWEDAITNKGHNLLTDILLNHNEDLDNNLVLTLMHNQRMSENPIWTSQISACSDNMKIDEKNLKSALTQLNNQLSIIKDTYKDKEVSLEIVDEKLVLKTVLRTARGQDLIKSKTLLFTHIINFLNVNKDYFDKSYLLELGKLTKIVNSFSESQDKKSLLDKLLILTNELNTQTIKDDMLLSPSVIRRHPFFLIEETKGITIAKGSFELFKIKDFLSEKVGGAQFVLIAPKDSRLHYRFAFIKETAPKDNNSSYTYEFVKETTASAFDDLRQSNTIFSDPNPISIKIKTVSDLKKHAVVLENGKPLNATAYLEYPPVDVYKSISPDKNLAILQSITATITRNKLEKQDDDLFTVMLEGNRYSLRRHQIPHALIKEEPLNTFLRSTIDAIQFENLNPTEVNEILEALKKCPMILDGDTISKIDDILKKINAPITEDTPLSYFSLTKHPHFNSLNGWYNKQRALYTDGSTAYIKQRIINVNVIDWEKGCQIIELKDTPNVYIVLKNNASKQLQVNWIFKEGEQYKFVETDEMFTIEPNSQQIQDLFKKIKLNDLKHIPLTNFKDLTSILK